MSLRKRKGFMAPCAFLLGFLSVVAQVYLMRELMIVFSGNELVFGLVLGVWLFGTALGSMLLKMRSRAWVVWLFLGSLLLLPVVLLGSRFLNHFLGIPSGNLTDLGRVVLGSFLLILPVAVLLGGIYGVLVRLYKDAVRIYIFETAGFALGGLVTVVVFLFPCPPGLDQFSRMASWPGYSFVEQRQSHYGHLMVIERASQKSLVENGRHLLTGDNVLSAEEVHPPLLWHPDPQDVLMVGGGFSQAGKEALKHPLSRLVYAELDPELLRLEEKHFSFVDDQRLQLITGDPRRYLRGSKDLYDVIVIHAGDPLSLLSARFFSRDFFMEARQRLKPGGILAVSQSLSENYVALKGRAYASSVYTTLFSVFSNVQFIPGDQLIWMATDSGYLLSFDILNQRLKARGVATQYMDASYFKDRMSPNRARLMRRWLSLSEEISTDEKPLAMVKALSFLTERTDTAFSAVVDFLIRRGGWLWGALPLVAGMVFLRREKWDGLMWGMGITGLTQMAFQVTVILGVQAFFGHAYALVGVLSAGFMSGALIGALWGPRFLRTNVMAWAISFQVLMALGLLMCWQYCPEGLFILSILGGMAGGNLFAIYVSRVTHERAGYVYAADLLGACAGALVVGVFLIPLWGVVTTMLWVALLNLVLLGGCTRLRGFNGT